MGHLICNFIQTGIIIMYKQIKNECKKKQQQQQQLNWQ